MFGALTFFNFLSLIDRAEISYRNLSASTIERSVSSVFFRQWKMQLH